MKINVQDIVLNVEESMNNSSGDNYIFFLHGFTGSSNDWREIIPTINKKFNAVAIDLIGHGESSSPGNADLYSAESMVEQIRQVILHYTDKPVIIAGYSMGGRAALSFSAAYPEMVRALILESSSAGIREEDLRLERAAQDEKLAEFILSHPIEEFADYWMNIGLFDSQKNLPAGKLAELKNSKLKNSKAGLANSLRGFSTGKMPPLHDKIKVITSPVLLITGMLDVKYTSLNSGMVKLFPDAAHKIIENAGHNTHLERPLSFSDVINDFLKRF